MNDFGEVVMRDGVPVEKGITLTREFLDANQELFTKYLNLWILYPDIFLDTVQNVDDAKNFHLMPFQRIALRASMRYRYHFWTATRATSKSFTAYLCALVRAILLPNSSIMIASEVKGTVINIAKTSLHSSFAIGPYWRKNLQLVKMMVKLV